MNGQNNKRKVLIIAGASDIFLGAVIALIGLGFFPVDVANYGVPPWVVIVVGGVIFASGTWIVLNNYSRLGE